MVGFLDSTDGDARWPLLGTAAVLAGIAIALAFPEMAIAGVPGLPLEALRQLAPFVGLASLVIAGSAFWRREHLAVATVALAFAGVVLYLNAVMLPQLDPLLSPRTVARRVQEASAPDRVSMYRLHRAWDFGLDYYLHRELPEWAPDEFVGPALVVTNEKGVDQLRNHDVSVQVLHHDSREGILVRLTPTASPSSSTGSTGSTSER
jgi:hypothetical protein